MVYSITVLDTHKEVSTGDIAALNRAYEKVHHTECTLSGIARRMNDDAKIERVETLDGYLWFWGLFFPFAEGEIVFLFPWAKTESAACSLTIDRSIAVYTKGVVTECEIKNIASALFQELEAFYRSTRHP